MRPAQPAACHSQGPCVLGQACVCRARPVCAGPGPCVPGRARVCRAEPVCAGLGPCVPGRARVCRAGPVRAGLGLCVPGWARVCRAGPCGSPGSGIPQGGHGHMPQTPGIMEGGGNGCLGMPVCMASSEDEGYERFLEVSQRRKLDV